MRLGGLASGVDTQTMIRDLMNVERQPLNRFFQRKQTVEWQRDAYREMNLLLKNLEQEAVSKIRLQSSLNTRQATSSNTSAFTATATADARNGTYEVNVQQVATRTRNVGTANVSSEGQKISTTQSLASQFDKFSVAPEAGSFALTVDGKQRTFTVDLNKSLNDVFKQINDSDLGIRAYYDTAYDKVVLERKDTGAFVPAGNQDIGFDDANHFLGSVLKLSQNAETAGRDAIIDFKNPVFGETITETSKTNRVTIGGITINATQMGAGTIEVTSNTDQAFNNIKAFVEKYNETIAVIQTKINEPRHRGFPPLTDEQRKELSEREAEMWDEKAKSGLLRRDNTLSSILSKMRLDLSSPVATTGQFNQLSQIGITTSSNFRDGGVLEIDETKLRQALADNPKAVHQLLNNTASTEATTTSEKFNQTGLVGRIRTSITGAMSEIVSRAGNEYRTNQQFTLGRELNNLDNQIDRFQQRLTQIEDRYWSQFTRMEKAMNQANAQMANLMQFVGGSQQ